MIGRGLVALLLTNFFNTVAYIGLITFAGDQVFRITGRELDLGLLALCAFVPIFFLAPAGGTTADRFDKRIVYGIASTVMLVVAVTLVFVVSADPQTPAPFFALIAVYGGARSFAAPAGRTLPIDLAPPEILQRVIALKAVAFQAGIIVGPVLAGFAAVIDPSLPYVISAGALVIAIALLVAVPEPTTARLEGGKGFRGAFADAVEGLRYIRTNRIVLAAIGLDLFAVLLGGATALLPAIAEKRLGVGEVGLGWLRAADGIGATAMSLTLSVWAIKRRVGKILLSTVAVFGVATIVLGFTTSYAVAFGAIVVLSAADAVSVFIRSTLVPLATPEEMRGRVIAVENVFIGGSNELGALESGVAAQFFGLVGAVVTGGIGTLAVVATWWKVFPRLRDVDRFEDVRVPT